MAMRTHFAVASAAFAHPISLAFSTLPAHPLSCHRRHPPCVNSHHSSVRSWSTTLSSKRSFRERSYHSVASSYRPAHTSHYFASHGNINLHHRRSSQSQSTTRLFGSNPNSRNAQPGQILLSDDRDDPSPTPIDIEALHRTIATIRDIIGYPTYDVSLSLVDEAYMQEINGSTRGVDASTDVLSFCFHEKIVEPGVLGEAQFDVADYYNLGDMLIDVDYVRRRCEEDRKLHAEEEKEGGKEKDDDSENSDGMLEGEVISEQIMDSSDTEQFEEEDGYEYEYIEVETDEWDDRGVAPAMQYIYNPEIRIHMLIVHGMLHLVGYDHIEDDDYELMVEREDEVLAELKSRLGDNFGVAGGSRALLE